MTCLLNKIINIVNDKDHNVIHTKVSCTMEIYHKTVCQCTLANQREEKIGCSTLDINPCKAK